MAKRHLEALGYEVDVAEHWVQRKGSKYGFRRDLFHCIDVVGLKDGQWLNVQACVDEAFTHAKDKVQKAKEIKRILATPTDFEIWEFYRDGSDSEWWIRRWRPVTADGIPVDWILTTHEPSLDRVVINLREKARRQKVKEKESGQARLAGLEGDGTPF